MTEPKQDPPIIDENPEPEAPRETYTPRSIIPKLVYLGLSLVVCTFAGFFLWEPLGRLVFGETAEVPITEIRMTEPGKDDIVYKYRRNYEDSYNLSIRFQYYVSINIDGTPTLYRVSVDSRKTIVNDYNVNDRFNVAYYPDDPDRLAFAYLHARTWGVGALYGVVGLTMLITAIPMLWTTGKPIEVDPG